jgi:recombination protein RecT
VSTAIATLTQRHASLAGDLEKHRERLGAIIPAAMGMTPSRAIAVVLDAVVRQPELLDCTRASIVRAVLQAAEVGLELGSPLGEAYLVPFRNWKRGNQQEAQFVAGYKGLIRLMLMSPEVSHVDARIVREADVFDYDYGTSPQIKHRPGVGDIRQRGDVVAAYAIVHHVGGGFQFDVMDRAELDLIRASAKATKPSAPWNAHTDEMFRKCPVRRLAKYVRLSPLGRRCVELDELSAQARGEYGGGEARAGFMSGRAEELKGLLGAGGKPVTIIEGEIE